MTINLSVNRRVGGVGELRGEDQALEAFKVRKIKDFTVSDRVWDIAKKAQTELELALSVSLEEGKSAVQLSREIRNLQIGRAHV